MTPLRRMPLAIRIYGAALWLCPPAFRRQYGDQMLRDFIEARDDARAKACDDATAEVGAGGRGRAVRRFAAQMAIDLARTIAVQWVRGGGLAIVAAAIVCSLTLAGLLAGFAQRLRVDVPPRNLELDTLFVVLLVSVIVIVLASTIIFTQWFAASIRRPARRRLRY